MKKNYWQRRAEANFIYAENISNAYRAQKLKRLYKTSYNALQNEINAFYGKYATKGLITPQALNTCASRAEILTFSDLIKEYFREVKNNGLKSEYAQFLRRTASITRLKLLQKQVKFELDKLNFAETDEGKTILKKVFSDVYYKTVYDTSKELHTALNFTKINAGAVEKIVNTKWENGNFSSRVWDNKEKLKNNLEKLIAQQMTVGTSSGDLAKQLKDKMNVGYNNAIRLIRTETSHIANEASYQTYVDTGLVKQYQILATLDDRTSDICASLDGQIFNLDDKQEGINFPPFHPNCRTTTIPYFKDNESERIARGPDDKNYFAGDINYSQWKKQNNIS